MTSKIPPYIETRIRQRPPKGLPIVPGSTPVVSFGDVRKAKVATLGLNPSKREFFDKHGKALAESDRRLATCKSLGVRDLGSASTAVIHRVFEECNGYFQKNPYRGWFDQLENYVLQPLKASYYKGSACHLDLVQWATDPTWGDLKLVQTRSLIEADLDFLRQQLLHEHIELLLLNGSGVAKRYSRLLECPLTVKLISGREGVKLFLGRSPQGARVIGWNKNFQSARGVSNEYRSAVGQAIVKERER